MHTSPGEVLIMLTRAYALLLATALTALVVPPSTRAATKAESTPTPTPTRPAILVLGAKHVIYVLAVGADEPTRGKIIASLAERLQDYRLKDDAWVFPEPDWTLADYVNQCGKDKSGTEGALVVGIAATASGTIDRFFYRKNWTELDANAVYITCDPLGYAWHSRIEIGTHMKSTYTQLFSAVSLILALGSTVAPFIPSHEATSSTVTVFPTTNPISSGGEISQVTKGSQTAINPSALNTAATALLAPALTFANPSSPPPISDELTWNAAEDAVSQIAAQMNCPPTSQGSPVPKPTAENTPTPAVFCAVP